MKKHVEVLVDNKQTRKVGLVVDTPKWNELIIII